ncbi:MAG: CRISPR-associated endonuclease Cas2 [Planctomycetaceae bacterium]
MRFLVAYDICHPKRLRKVARCLERHGLRTQKSVFLADITEHELHSLFQELQTLIRDPDVVQAWHLAPDQPDHGIVCSSSAPMRAACLIADDARPLRVESRTVRTKRPFTF